MSSCYHPIMYSPLQVRIKNYKITNVTIAVLDRLDIVNLEFHNCLIDKPIWLTRPRYYTRTRLRGSSVMNSLLLDGIVSLPDNWLNQPLFGSIRSIITQLTVRNSRFKLGSGQFLEYRSLRLLVLHNCGLSQLTSESFRGLVNTLRYMDVTGNRLVATDLTSIGNFHLYDLKVLRGNDIVCNETFMRAMDTVSTFNNSLIRDCYTDFSLVEKSRNQKRLEGLRGILVWKNGFICLLGLFTIAVVLSSFHYSSIRGRIMPKKVGPITDCRELPKMY